VGDSGGFFNPQRIKGVHGAIQSGSMAADAIFTALQSKDGSGKTLAQYTDNLRNSRLYSELWRARNHHQAFERGMLRGIPHYLLQKVSKGRGLYKRYSSVAGHVSYTKPSDIKINRDNDNLVNAKLDSLYYSGVRHEEDQPAHLKIGSIDICLNRCTEEFGNPCTKFCPASVYELVEDRKHAELKINSANCLHCMTCDIMDPYQNIEWHVPESGGGPRYESM
jgi:electron-transferring-flavoprotein dehydrogenase